MCCILYQVNCLQLLHAYKNKNDKKHFNLHNIQTDVHVVKCKSLISKIIDDSMMLHLQH